MYFLSNINPISNMFLIILPMEKADNDVSKLKYKKLFLLVIPICAGLLCSFLKSSVNDIKNINMKFDGDELLCENCHLSLLESDEIENEFLNVKEDLEYFKVSYNGIPLGFITYVNRLIDDVSIKYLTYENLEQKITFSLSLNELEELYNFEKDNIEFEFSNTVGYNKNKLPIGYYLNDNGYLIIGRSITYRLLKVNYVNDNESVVYDLYEQYSDLNNSQKQIVINENENMDTFIIESNSELFSNKDSIQNYVDLLNSKSSGWMNYKGNLTKLPYSIEPFTREGYGRNLGRMLEDDAYFLSKKDDSSIFRFLYKNAVYTLLNHYALDDSGVWYSEYTSTWLKKDYGITSYYIDTRFNETIGYYFLELYFDLKNEEFLKKFCCVLDLR